MNRTNQISQLPIRQRRRGGLTRVPRRNSGRRISIRVKGSQGGILRQPAAMRDIMERFVSGPRVIC